MLLIATIAIPSTIVTIVATGAAVLALIRMPTPALLWSPGLIIMLTTPSAHRAMSRMVRTS